MLNRERFVYETKNKVKLLAEKLKEEEKHIININEFYEKIDLEKLNQKYFNDDYENLSLIEFSKKIKPKFYYEKIKGTADTHWASNQLSKYKVLGIDTSELLSTHIIPLFLVINVGIFYYDYSRTKYLEKNLPYFFSNYDHELESLVKEEGLTKWSVDYLRLNCELEAIEEIIKEIDIDGVFVFFDESFSSSYLYSFGPNIRIKILLKIKDNLDTLIKYGIYPISVYYTLSKTFVLPLSKTFNVDLKNINDRKFFNCVLDEGERSPLFKLESSLLKEAELNICGFYVKLSKDNVIRVEFPEEIKDKVDSIHEVVYLQSAIGNGYPYCLQRAHEAAYMSDKDKIFILRYINDQLRKETKNYELILTKKAERKIFRII
ncbi:MAG: DNA double-strand break repair nuclease NurA [Thermoproteota archaeon]|jgi:hypothetical protein|nr:DNA double-strand break repair nuclease NurA [Thermoproteota archaeon]